MTGWVDFNKTVHLNRWKGYKIQEGVVHPGFRGQQKLKFQVLGDQINESGLQGTGNIVQQNCQITAVNVVQAVDRKGSQ